MRISRTRNGTLAVTLSLIMAVGLPSVSPAFPRGPAQASRTASPQTAVKSHPVLPQTVNTVSATERIATNPRPLSSPRPSNQIFTLSTKAAAKSQDTSHAQATSKREMESYSSSPTVTAKMKVILDVPKHGTLSGHDWTREKRDPVIKLYYASGDSGRRDHFVVQVPDEGTLGDSIKVARIESVQKKLKLRKLPELADLLEPNDHHIGGFGSRKPGDDHSIGGFGSCKPGDNYSIGDFGSKYGPKLPDYRAGDSFGPGGSPITNPWASQRGDGDSDSSALCSPAAAGALAALGAVAGLNPVAGVVVGVAIAVQGYACSSTESQSSTTQETSTTVTNSGGSTTTTTLTESCTTTGGAIKSTSCNVPATSKQTTCSIGGGQLNCTTKAVPTQVDPPGDSIDGDGGNRAFRAKFKLGHMLAGMIKSKDGSDVKSEDRNKLLADMSKKGVQSPAGSNPKSDDNNLSSITYQFKKEGGGQDNTDAKASMKV